MSVGELLRAAMGTINDLRVQLGLSQAALGARTGRSQATTANLLSGRSRDVKLSTLDRLARGVGAEVYLEIRPECPIRALNKTWVIFHCPCGWTCAGPRGEVSAVWNPIKNLWGLWIGQGAAFPFQVERHMNGCWVARQRMRIEIQ